MSEQRTNPPRPRRPRRLLRAGAVGLIVAAVFAAAMWYFIIPQLARGRVDALLSRYEPGRRTFTIESIGFSHLSLTGIELGGQPWLRAGRVDVRYRLSELLRGKVTDIVMNDFEWRVAARGGGVDWGFTVPPRTAPSHAPLPFEAVSLRNGRLRLDAGQRAILLAFDCSAAVDALGTLRGDLGAHEVSLWGEPLAGSIKSTFEFDGSHLNARTDWPLIPDAPTTSAITLDFDGPDGAAGTIVVAQPKFTLGKAEFLKALWPALAGIHAAGRTSIDARFTLAGGRVFPLITLKASAVALASDRWPLAIAEAEGTLVFDSLSPLSTDGPQHVRIASATSGEVDITGARIEAELDESGLLQVLAARWFMSDGGRYEVAPTTIDLENPRIASTVTCSNVDLDFWLRLMTGDRADGQGRLQGEFAFDWNPRARPRIQFTSGSLVAVPASGYVRIHDAPALSDLLDQADPRFSVDQTLRVVKERILAALQDLGYTSLRLGFVPDGRDTTLRAELQGKGRRGERPQEFSGLIMNISHFGQTLQNVLDTVSAADRLRELRLRPPNPPVPPVGAPQEGSS